MSLKEKVEKKLKESGVTEYKLIYKKESTYQKRFKKQFREEEVWLYPKGGTEEYILDGKKKRTFGLLIRESEVKDKEYFNEVIEILKYDLKQ